MSERDEDYAHNVNTARHMIRDDLASIRGRLTLMERQIKRLGDGPGNLYDVEFVEAAAGGEKVAAQALATIRLGLAALDGLVPAPEVP